MNYENLLNAIEKEFEKTLTPYFEYAWREELGDFLEKESKYVKLVEWIKEQLKLYSNIMNVFSPADRNERTTLKMVNCYRASIERIAILVHCKALLLDKRTTTKMRENVEYTLCELYKIYYDKKFDGYMYIGDEK